MCCLSFDMILYANRTTQNDAASFHRLLFFSKRPIGNQVPVGQSGPGCRPTRGHRTVNQGPLDGRSGASGRATRSRRSVDQGPAAGRPAATGRRRVGGRWGRRGRGQSPQRPPGPSVDADRRLSSHTSAPVPFLVFSFLSFLLPSFPIESLRFFSFFFFFFFFFLLLLLLDLFFSSSPRGGVVR